MLSQAYQCTKVLESFEDNPYLKNFYKNPEMHAFSLELHFMAERYQQQKSIFEKINLFEHQLVSDYAFFKSLIFANITLKEDELQLFKKLFHIINTNIKSPDIILYLHKPVDLLLHNIKTRARDYEQNITADYLQKLNSAYIEFFKQQNKSKVILLDTSNIDFVKKKADFEMIKEILNDNYNKKLNYL